MHILLSPTLCVHYCDYVVKFLVVWVKRSKIYGEHFLVYNVHSLIHLIEDVRNFGNLKNVSAFPFENFMRSIKSCIRKPQHVLRQLANRSSEGYFTKVSSERHECDQVKREHTSGPIIAGLLCYKQYKELHLKNVTIKLNVGDNCIMYGTKIALVSNICCSDGKTVQLIVQKFEKLKSFFSKP